MGNRLRCVRTCSGSQSQMAARLGLKPQPRGCPTSTNSSLPLCPSCLHQDPWGQRLGWEQACCPPRPCSATCLVCFPLLLPRECETPMSEGLAGCLPHTCPPPSFKKRRGHSVGGAPEQRYQSIPVCVAARPPTQVQDVLVREGLHHMPEAPVWRV